MISGSGPGNGGSYTVDWGGLPCKAGGITGCSRSGKRRVTDRPRIAVVV